MRSRWFIFDFIPSDVEIDPRLRREIRSAVRKDRSFLKSREGITRWLVALSIYIVLVAPPFYLAFLPRAPVSQLVARPLLMAASVVVAWIIGVAVFAPLRARHTYREMRLRGIDVCPTCGYWLRALPFADRCPECGAERPPIPVPPSQDPSQQASERQRTGTLPQSGFEQWR